MEARGTRRIGRSGWSVRVLLLSAAVALALVAVACSGGSGGEGVGGSGGEGVGRSRAPAFSAEEPSCTERVRRNTTERSWGYPRCSAATRSAIVEGSTRTSR